MPACGSGQADLVPTEANLLGEYGSFAELEAACVAFCAQVNARPHRVTRRVPAEMLLKEAPRLHPLPAAPFTAAFGVTRAVGENIPMVSYELGGVLGAPPAGAVRRCGCADTTSRSSSCTSGTVAELVWIAETDWSMRST